MQKTIVSIPRKVFPKKTEIPLNLLYNDPALTIFHPWNVRYIGAMDILELVRLMRLNAKKLIEDVLAKIMSVIH